MPLYGHIRLCKVIHANICGHTKYGHAYNHTMHGQMLEYIKICICIYELHYNKSTLRQTHACATVMHGFSLFQEFLGFSLSSKLFRENSLRDPMICISVQKQSWHRCPCHIEQRSPWRPLKCPFAKQHLGLCGSTRGVPSETCTCFHESQSPLQRAPFSGPGRSRKLSRSISRKGKNIERRCYSILNRSHVLARVSKSG